MAQDNKENPDPAKKCIPGSGGKTFLAVFSQAVLGVSEVAKVARSPAYKVLLIAPVSSVMLPTAPSRAPD